MSPTTDAALHRPAFEVIRRRNSGSLWISFSSFVYPGGRGSAFINSSPFPPNKEQPRCASLPSHWPPASSSLSSSAAARPRSAAKAHSEGPAPFRPRPFRRARAIPAKAIPKGPAIPAKAIPKGPAIPAKAIPKGPAIPQGPFRRRRAIRQGSGRFPESHRPTDTPRAPDRSGQGPSGTFGDVARSGARPGAGAARRRRPPRRRTSPPAARGRRRGPGCTPGCRPARRRTPRAAQPTWAARSRSSPQASAARKPARNASPTPVGSTLRRSRGPRRR